MRKTELTIEGKTWGGEVSALPAKTLSRLCQVIQMLDWTGGAEIECIRAREGPAWIMEWNPRFPAYVHGVSLCGLNLPALLVATECSDVVLPAIFHQQTSSEGAFVRVVIETIRTERCGAGALMLSSHKKTAASVSDRALIAAHPSGMPVLANQFNRPESDTGPEPLQPAHLRPDRAIAILAGITATPVRVFLPESARARFDTVLGMRRRFAKSPVRLNIAYSIKTNPASEILWLAQQYALGVEAISQAELHHALKHGFAADQMVLNGPAILWPPGSVINEPLGAVFCDSIADCGLVLTAIREHGFPSPRVFGFRLRPGNFPSRFGIPVDTDAETLQLCNCISLLPTFAGLGLQIHLASSVVGLDAWGSLVRSLIEFSARIERLTNRAITILDFGGGWAPEQWDYLCSSDLLSELMQHVSNTGHVQEVLLEPGKALAQECFLVVSQILTVRCSAQGNLTDVVCDASIAELPDLASHPHRIVLYQRKHRRCEQLRPGQVALLGRLCMEHDVIAHVHVPSDIAPGDYIFVLDAGAYDASMRFRFGEGTYW